MELEPVTPASKIMRIAIHGEEPRRGDTVYLKLVQVSEQEIVLAAVDDNGEILLDPLSWEHGGALLTVAGGHVSISPMLMPSLGFELDRHGRIKLDPWTESTMAKHAQRYGGMRATLTVIEAGEPTT